MVLEQDDLEEVEHLYQLEEEEVHDLAAVAEARGSVEVAEDLG